MDYIFNGYHFQDKSEGSKSKFYVLGIKDQSEIDKLEKMVAEAVNYVTIEDQLNKGKVASFGIAPLYNSNKTIVGCAIYIKKNLLKKLAA
jgi:hypothetical protein